METKSLDHLNMHHDHRVWNSDIKMWYRDIMMWHEELTTLEDSLKMIGDAFKNHLEGVEAHRESIDEHKNLMDKHELDIKLLKEGSVVDEVLAEEHLGELNLHEKLAETHERVKKYHHSVTALTRGLLHALEKAI